MQLDVDAPGSLVDNVPFQEYDSGQLMYAVGYALTGDLLAG